MINLDKKYMDIVIEILKAHIHDYEVRAFGSRVNGTTQKFSDLDIVIMSDKKINWRELESLRDSFSESDLPITVDVVDWMAISDEFRKIINEKHVKIFDMG